MTRRIRTPLFLALGLVALAACKKEGIEIKPPDPIIAVTRAEDPGVVSLASALPQRLVAADKAAEIRVRLRIDASKLEHGKRPPINVVLVMDSSGSMEGKAIEDAREAALALVDGLAEGDRLAVVTFDSLSRVLVPSTKIDANTQSTIRKQIETMTARGTTDLAAGLASGLAEAQRGYLNNGVNRLVLLSDGVPNDDSQITNLAQQAANMHVSVTALGLGLEYVALIERAEPEARAAAKLLADSDLKLQADGLGKLRKALPTLVPAANPIAIAGPFAPNSTQPSATMAMPMAPADSPATVKRSHGKAMQRLQGE